MFKRGVQKILEGVVISLCAILCMQLPFFITQYAHQLKGHVDELKWQVEQMESAASFSGKNLDQYISKFTKNSDRDFASQGVMMRAMKQRFEKLSYAWLKLKESSAFTRPFVFFRYMQSDVFAATCKEFKMGISFTLESIVFALIGILIGSGLCTLVTLSFGRSMKKALSLVLFCVTLILSSCSTSTEPEEISIAGLWKSRDQHSDKPRALVAIYKYQDKYYGRMLATYDDEGKIQDTILEQKGKAPGVVGNPPYCGLDFIYDVKKEEDSGEGTDRYKGKILDPEKGKAYKAEFWLRGNDLIVRGELWIFGKNIPWHKASKQDLPKGFSMSDIKRFVPKEPLTKTS